MKTSALILAFLLSISAQAVDCDFDAMGEKTSIRFDLPLGEIGKVSEYSTRIYHPDMGNLLFVASHGYSRIPGWENIGKYQIKTSFTLYNENQSQYQVLSSHFGFKAQAFGVSVECN